jgi:hypothetical protein
MLYQLEFAFQKVALLLLLVHVSIYKIYKYIGTTCH